MTGFRISSLSISLSAATVNGTSVPWPALIAAAQQPDARLAAEYRAILAQLLPLVRMKEEAAYAAYVRQGLTTHGGSVHAAGHGSWVTGPSPTAQAHWLAWRRLHEDLQETVAAPAREAGRVA